MCALIIASCRAVGTGDRIPTDPSVAIFKSFGGSGPTEDGHKGLATVFRIVFVNFLPQDMAGAELADFKRLGGGANLEGGIDVNSRGKGRRGDHNSFIMQLEGLPFRQKITISVWPILSPYLPIALGFLWWGEFGTWFGFTED